MGPTLTKIFFFFFKLMRGEMIKIPQKWAIIGPPAKGHLNGVLRPDDGLTLNSGLVALRFFRGSGPVLLSKPIFSSPEPKAHG